MLPGKKYKPEDLLRILRRRIWLLIVPFAMVSAATAVVARLLPDRYRSETLLLVEPQRVPENYVRATVTTPIERRLMSISQQILSRTRLERLIEEFNLYESERKTGIMQDVIEEMRRDIDIRVVRGDVFRVSYTGSDARTVMRVTERLASSVIEENLVDREVLAEGTNQFLEAQVEEARRRLMEHEQKLEVYKRRFAGELPSQLDSNLQAIQNTQMQIQAIIESINRDQDRRLAIERVLADMSADAAAAAAQSRPVPVGSVAQQLAVAQSTLQSLELRFKPGHPDIAMWKRRIRDLETAAEAEALSAPVSEVPVTRTSQVETMRQRRVRDLEEEIKQLDKQVAAKLDEEKRLRGASGNYLQRVEAIPTRESELIELTRDYTTLQAMYTNLLAKKEESKVAANLERRQIGEQLKLIDPARMPERPFSPNRVQISFAGMAGGFMLGLLLIALMEYRDGSFRTDNEIASVIQLPVLAVVPMMMSDVERRRLRRRNALWGFGLGSTVMACWAVVVYTFVR